MKNILFIAMISCRLWLYTGPVVANFFSTFFLATDRWHALSRIIGDHKELVADWHQEYMKCTFQSLQDPVERVQAKNLSAFLYFGELMDPSDMEIYAHEFITQLVSKMNNQSHRAVTEECITSHPLPELLT